MTLQELLGISLPIIQAPMAGPVLADMVVAVSEAGGLGFLGPAGALLSGSGHGTSCGVYQALSVNSGSQGSMPAPGFE